MVGKSGLSILLIIGDAWSESVIVQSLSEHSAADSCLQCSTADLICSVKKLARSGNATSKFFDTADVSAAVTVVPSANTND